MRRYWADVVMRKPRGHRWVLANAAVANTMGFCAPVSPAARWARRWLLQDGTEEGLAERYEAMFAAYRLGGGDAVLALTGLGTQLLRLPPKGWKRMPRTRLVQTVHLWLHA